MRRIAVITRDVRVIVLDDESGKVISDVPVHLAAGIELPVMSLTSVPGIALPSAAAAPTQPSGVEKTRKAVKISEAQQHALEKYAQDDIKLGQLLANGASTAELAKRFDIKRVSVYSRIQTYRKRAKLRDALAASERTVSERPVSPGANRLMSQLGVSVKPIHESQLK